MNRAPLKIALKNGNLWTENSVKFCSKKLSWHAFSVQRHELVVLVGCFVHFIKYWKNPRTYKSGPRVMEKGSRFEFMCVVWAKTSAQRQKLFFICAILQFLQKCTFKIDFSTNGAHKRDESVCVCVGGLSFHGHMLSSRRFLCVGNFSIRVQRAKANRHVRKKLPRHL